MWAQPEVSRPEPFVQSQDALLAVNLHKAVAESTIVLALPGGENKTECFPQQLAALARSPPSTNSAGGGVLPCCLCPS